MINRFIADHAPRNKLNLIIYDGDLLYVHKNLNITVSDAMNI
jgi:glutamine amidotransferase